MMKEQLEAIRKGALEAIAGTKAAAELDALRVKYLGKKGELTAVLKLMGSLSAEERPVMGQMANEVRAAVEKAVEAQSAILEKAAQFSTLQADCVEWRADWFEDFQSPAAIARCVQKLRVALRDKLLLVTFRTKAEGGEQALSHKEYLAFLHLILDTDCADLLDIEFFTAGTDLPKLVEQAHSAGVAVVCSSHDFAKTPPRAELVCRMVQMQQAGADLPKLAVMPQSRTDVLELLAATAEMADLHPETPVITMSMGALGAVSRLAGETFGSAMTFANPGQASAPGQVSLNIVNEVLDALHL